MALRNVVVQNRRALSRVAQAGAGLRAPMSEEEVVAGSRAVEEAVPQLHADQDVVSVEVRPSAKFLADR